MRRAWMLIALAGSAAAQTVDQFGKSEAEYLAEIEAEVAKMPLVEAERPWNAHAYTGFRESIDKLTGPGAHDCGYYELDGQHRLTAEIHAEVRRCVEAAIASGNPFKFGQEGLAVDAWSWKVIARAPAGELWVIQISGAGPYSDGKLHQLNQVCQSARFFSDIRTLEDGCVDKSRGPLPVK